MSPEIVASRYRILRELGRGGMGVVYLVEHLHTGEHLALKLLHGWAAEDPGVVTRFKREARVGAQIKSDFVVRVTDADVAPELGGAPFFVMEMLDGLDVDKLVATVGPLHRDVVLFVMSQIAKALEKAHALGIVHRDLKPENIFLHRREDDTPVTKILDFGISKIISRAGSPSASLGATADGTVMGTPYYMAPEQARGLVDLISPATDLWAIGLIAYRMLTGQVYWTANTNADLMIQILIAELPRPSERAPFLGAKFDAWFRCSCAREPSQRWTSIGQQVAALADALGDRHYDRARPVESSASMGTVIRALRGQPVEAPSAHASGVAQAPSSPPFGPPPVLVDPTATTSGRGGMSRTDLPLSGPRSRSPVLAVGLVLAGVALAGVGYLFFRPSQADVAQAALVATPKAPVAAPSAEPAQAAPPLAPRAEPPPVAQDPARKPAASSAPPPAPKPAPGHHAPRTSTPTKPTRVNGAEPAQPAYDPLAP